MTLTILDTGTTPTDEACRDGVDIIHRPALLRQAIDVDKRRLRPLLNTPCHLLFYSQFSVRQVIDQELIAEPHTHHFWAVGTHTAALLSSHFDVTPQVPDDSNFQSLKARLLDGGPPLDLISFGLRARCRDLSDLASTWEVNWTCIDIYSSDPAPAGTIRDAFQDHQPDWITLTSSRGVQSVVDAIGTSALHTARQRRQLRFAAIGPSTAATAAQRGLDVDLIPEITGRRPLIEAIVAHSTPAAPPT